MMFRFIQERFDPRLREAPRPCIQGLFLTPHNGLCVRVRVEVVAKLLPGEWVELLDAGDCGVFQGWVRGAVFVEGGIGLAGAEDDARDVLVRIDLRRLVRGVGDNPLEMGLAREVFDGGAREGMTEE